MNVTLFLEIKNELTEHLVDTITPYIYEGLTSIYKEAARLAEENGHSEKTLMIFQKLLQSINVWSQIRINDETNRIKQSSNTADYLDDLVKAVIRSNITLLTYSNTVSNIIGQSFYNSLTTATFIHRCYTECGKDAHNNPYLFFHDIDPMDFKRNQIIINSKIQDGITRAIRKILPISLILKEYLVNSLNIIQEPPKVELLGLGGPAGIGPFGENNIMIDNLPQVGQIMQSGLPVPGLAVDNCIPSKNDSKLENEVLNIIRSESNKPDEQKIQAILNIDKIITSETKKNAIRSCSNHSAHINRNHLGGSDHINSRNSPKITNNYLYNPNLLEDEDCRGHGCGGGSDIINSKLDTRDKNILNINIENEPTVEPKSNQYNISATSLNGRGLPGLGRAGLKMNPETSERIIPSKVNLIENYGAQQGGSKKHKPLRK